MAQGFFVVDDLHGAPAQHVAWAHEHGVADALCRFHARLDVRHRFALRLGDAELLHHLFKRVAVFRAADGFHVRADDLHAHRVQAVRQVDGRLPAQAHDHALRLFQRQDVHDVFHGQRFEIQLVRGGVIGGHGFGVVVDDNGLVARFPDGPDGVHGGVVKLHALPDADGAGAQHHDLLFRGYDAFVLLLVGGVEIGHVACKLAGAGIDHLVHRQQTLALAETEDILLRLPPHLADVLVADAQVLGGAQHVRVVLAVDELHLEIDDVLDLFQEKQVDLRFLVDAFQRRAQADQLRDGENTVVGCDADVGKQLFGFHAGKFGHVQMADADLQRAHGL